MFSNWVPLIFYQYGYPIFVFVLSRSLCSTLEAVHTELNGQPDNVLIIGRRRNLDLNLYSIGNGSDLARLTKIGCQRILFHSSAIDYFIVSRHGFDWESVPDFVVGRVGYDNWLVGKAIRMGYKVIDASNNILAVHQVGVDGVKSGLLTNPNQTHLNMHIIDDNLNYRHMVHIGRITRSQYYTLCNKSVSTDITNECGACGFILLKKRL